MKDNLLFQYIRNAVKEKQIAKPSSQTTNFAQKYCKQQLIKKKLNVHNPHEKMTHLMKNFKNLDTYVDLPELIESIKRWKFRQIKEAQTSKPSFLIRQQNQSSTLHKKIKKELGDKIKQKYLSDNTQADEMLNFLEKHTRIRSDGLKNCSYSNLNNLFEAVSQEGDDQTWKGGFDFLETLHKVNQMSNVFHDDKITGVNNSDEIYVESELNSKLRKEYTKLLHKVTTYLQIILQTEHKQKWDSKKQMHKSQHIFHNFDKQKQKNTKTFLPQANSKNFSLAKLKQERMKKNFVLQENKENEPVLNQTMRVNKSRFLTHKKEFTENLQVYQSENNKSPFPGPSKIRYPKDLNNDDDNKNMMRQNFFKSMYCQPGDKENTFKEKNDSFNKTTSSFKFRTQAIMTYNKHKKFNSLIKPSMKDIESQKSKKAVKQNFTFRNRNIKQRIVNKISNFIHEIDQQQHNNKRQNNYYNTAINKLESTLNMCFGQFKQQAVAGDADIETLKKYATCYNHNNGPGPVQSSWTYNQLLSLNEDGLFAFNSNSHEKAQIDGYSHSIDQSSFQNQSRQAEMTTS